MVDVSHLSKRELLALYAALSDELRALDLTRSSKNPTGDFAEYRSQRSSKPQQ